MARPSQGPHSRTERLWGGLAKGSAPSPGDELRHGLTSATCFHPPRRPHQGRMAWGLGVHPFLILLSSWLRGGRTGLGATLLASWAGLWRGQRAFWAEGALGRASACAFPLPQAPTWGLGSLSCSLCPSTSSGWWDGKGTHTGTKAGSFPREAHSFPFTRSSPIGTRLPRPSRPRPAPAAHR